MDKRPNEYVAKAKVTILDDDENVILCEASGRTVETTVREVDQAKHAGKQRLAVGY